jgi:hypothetical protein
MTSEVNAQVHEVVVVKDGEAFPFMLLSTAILFLENMYAAEKDYEKVVNKVAAALSDDKAHEDVQIYSIEEYEALFGEETDESEDDEANGF